MAALFRSLWTLLLLFAVMSSCARADAPSGAPPRALVRAPEIDLGAVMRRVHFAFRAEGGAWSGGHATYAVRADTQDLRVTPRHPGAAEAANPLRLALAGIARGSARIDGDTRVAVREDGALAIARGAVIERLENREEGVEQSFAFAARPAGAGDLVVRIAASGLDYAGATQGGLHFTDAATGLGVRYGQATWIDARGKKSAAKAGWDDGYVVITVPAGVVEESAYPAVLDPIIGPEMEMDVPVLAPAAAGMPAVAFGGGNYLVVWADYRTDAIAGGQGAMIVAARVTPAGTVLDPSGFVVARPENLYSGNLLTPAVTWNGSTWLVGWVDKPSGVLRGARVNAQATVLDPDGITIAPDVGYYPALASDGTNFLVAYPTWNALSYRRIGPDGALLDPVAMTAFSFSGSANGDLTPRLSYSGSSYLLTYRYGFTLGESHLAARRIAPDGSLLDATEIALSSEPGESPVAASDGSGWLVVWRRSAGGIRGQRVQADGSLLDGADGFTISTATATDLGVVRGASDYAVLWLQDQELHGARVDSSGTVLATAGAILAEPGWISRLELASDGVGYLAVGEPGSVRGVRLDAALSKLDSSSFLISVKPNDQYRPAVAYNGTDWLVVWIDKRGGGPAADVYGTRVSASGKVLDPSGLAIAVSSLQKYHLAVASNGTDWLVVYHATPDLGPVDLRATRVSAQGVPLDPGGIVLAQKFLGGYAPAVASDGADYLVVWSSGVIRVARVTAGGAVLDPGGVTTTIGGAGTPGVAWNGANYLVAASNNSSINIARLSPQGDVLSESGLGQGDDEVAVTSDGTNWLVAWATWSGDVRAHRFGPDGKSLAPQSIAISHGTTPLRHATAAWDGQQYWVAWMDSPVLATMGDVHAARISGSGTLLDPDGLPVGAPSHDAIDPVLSAGPEKHVLLAYWGYDDTPGYAGVRVRARILSDPTPIGGPCSEAAACTSGFCVDGVCCEEACAGLCQACSAAKKGSGVDGVCGLVAAGTDPDDDCTDEGASACQQNGLCNGNGSCAIWPAGTVCQAASCDGATQQAASLCDGLGTCAAGAVTSCAAGQVCDPVTGGCVELVDAGAGGAGPVDAGAPLDAGAGGTSSLAFGGCGCRASGASGTSPFAAVIALWLTSVLRRRFMRRRHGV